MASAASFTPSAAWATRCARAELERAPGPVPPCGLHLVVRRYPGRAVRGCGDGRLAALSRQRPAVRHPHPQGRRRGGGRLPGRNRTTRRARVQRAGDGAISDLVPPPAGDARPRPDTGRSGAGRPNLGLREGRDPDGVGAVHQGTVPQRAPRGRRIAAGRHSGNHCADRLAAGGGASFGHRPDPRWRSS